MVAVFADKVRPGQFVINLGYAKAVHVYKTDKAVKESGSRNPHRVGRLDNLERERARQASVEECYQPTEARVVIETTNGRKAFDAADIVTVTA